MKTVMHFELDIDRRNISDQLLLDDIVAVAERLETDSPTTTQYQKHGRFAVSTIRRRFKNWSNALSQANLQVTRPAQTRRLHLKAIHNNAGINCDEAIADLMGVAALLKSETVTNSQYAIHGHYCAAPFLRHFGSWNNALSAAGLKITKRARILDDELFEKLEQMWRALGRQPKYREVERPFSRVSKGVYESRFGSWRKALEAFVDYANTPQTEVPNNAESTPAAVLSPVVPQSAPNRRTTPRAVNWRLRFLIMQRDGFRCRACGASPATTAGVKLQVDHVMPWSEGGATIYENLQTLCETCNNGKSNLTEGDMLGVPLQS